MIRPPRTALNLALSLVLLAASTRAARAEENAPAPPGRTRPKVALVLSGGGARGAAHVGVLKVLEELHVPVDLVVGTSMGSIVGGFYATGWRPDGIERMMSDMEWKSMFVDQVARRDKTFRRRQDDAVYLIPTKLRFKGWKPYFPSGLLGGQRLELLLRSLEIQSTDESDFNRFPIPYRAVAVDLATGEAVVLDHGSLATAMRASMSVAGMFPPVEIDGQKLVDGGTAANLPIRIAQQLGAERIIAVDITSPLLEEEKLGSVFSVVSQLSGFLTVTNREDDIRALRPGDILIRPVLGDIGFTDFERVKEAIQIGEGAARAAAPALAAFSVDNAEYNQFQERHRRNPPQGLRIDHVALENSSWVDDRVVRGQLSLTDGEPFDDTKVTREIMHLHGLDYFGTIRHRFEQKEGERDLILTTPRKPYGKNSLQFGFSFEDDFQGENSYSLSARHQMLAVNRRGGEWVNVGQIGDRSLVRTVFYQPLDWKMKWFVSPGAETLRENQTLWLEQDPVADFRIETNAARLDTGRVFGEWGEIRLGAYYAHNQGQVRVGDPVIPEYDEKDGGVRLAFTVDTRDSSVFPKRGTFVSTWATRTSATLGGDVVRQQAYLLASQSWTFGRNTLTPAVEVMGTPVGEVTLVSAYTLGGLFRLTGLGEKQLVGQSGGLGRIVYLRELSRIDLGAISNRVFMGATAETGNVYQLDEAVTLDSLRHSGALFLGAQTVIGPAFVGVGFADGGQRRLYFQIGHRF